MIQVAYSNPIQRSPVRHAGTVQTTLRGQEWTAFGHRVRTARRVAPGEPQSYDITLRYPSGGLNDALGARRACSTARLSASTQPGARAFAALQHRMHISTPAERGRWHRRAQQRM